MAGMLTFFLGLALFLMGFLAGDRSATKEIIHECKSFQSTVIQGEKFRCELVQKIP